MASNHDLISLYEQFWDVRQRNGYIKLISKAGSVTARIADIRPGTKSEYDRLIILQDVDISGKKVTQTTFKLSDLVDAETVPLTVVRLKQ